MHETANKPRVLHVCYADSHEGAAIGAFRLHNAMLGCGVESRLLVIRKRRQNDTVIHIDKFRRLLIKIWNRLSRLILKLVKPANQGYRTLNVFPTGVHRVINRMDVDVVQMHWVCRNTLSIREIAKINKPLFWKLPDMWAFCGAEHYIQAGDPERYIEGYLKTNRPTGDRGLDIDRYLWRYKSHCWKNLDVTIVCPSKWLAGCASQSFLFKDRTVRNIANPIDLDRYRPLDQGVCRFFHDLPVDRKLILFGSINATTDKRKGYQFLIDSLSMFIHSEMAQNCDIVVMGASAGKSDSKKILDKINVHYLGCLMDEKAIVMAYSAADMVVLPTMADNLPNIIQEATACGVPCVGFNVGGMPDMIKHLQTGYLAEPYDPADLAAGMEWVLGQDKHALKELVRRQASMLHSPHDRVGDYIEMYQNVIG